MEEVCLYLLPKGKRKGNCWHVGNIQGDEGDSLHITMHGSAAGRFSDFSDKDVKGGTPLWLWSKVRNINFREAIKEAADWLGVQAEDFGIKKHHKQHYLAPNPNEGRVAEPNTPVMDYLTLERKLDPIVVASAKVGETDDGSSIIFNFADWNDEKSQWMLAHRKFLKLQRDSDGKKQTYSSKGTKRCLYGKNLIKDDVSEIVISEGEIDALSWQSYGIPAVSIPNGVQDDTWIDLDWEWLNRFEKIYLSMDMDEPGQQAAQDFCKRLGLHRCQIVSLPKKDCNDCLVGGVPREEMQKAIETSKPIELDEIKKPDSFKNEVLSYYDEDPSQQGWDTPWSPELPWKVRRGELTILSGFGGHGKTQGLNQLMIKLLSQDLRVMDASFEIRPGLTLYYMTRCALGQKFSSKEEATACMEWLNHGMFFLDCIGVMNVDRLFHAMEYARKRHGIDVFVIDSLFKLGLSSEDYGGQRELMDRLTTFCNNTGAHVILVAHSRKTQNGNELSVPSKADIAGSADIGNAAFNVIIFWRNKIKRRKLDEAKQSNNYEEIAKWQDQHDGQIIIDKQRFGEGEECAVMTWFNRESCQFHLTNGRNIKYFELK